MLIQIFVVVMIGYGFNKVTEDNFDTKKRNLYVRAKKAQRKARKYLEEKRKKFDPDFPSRPEDEEPPESRTVHRAGGEKMSKIEEEVGSQKLKTE